MDVTEEFRQFVLPPAPEGEDIGVCDRRIGPLDDEDICLLLRRIDFKKIITFHTKETQHKLQKSENANKKLKDTVSFLQGELEKTIITCGQQQVKIQELQKKMGDGGRLEIIETKLEELQVEEANNGDDCERLQIMETQVEELKMEETRSNDRLEIIETKIEELVSENEINLQVPQHQDIYTQEIKEVEKNIIIKNLPMVSSTEDQKQTTTMVKDVFRQISLPSTVKFSAKRIFNTKKESMPGRNGRKGWPPIVHVTFKSTDTKKELFQQLQQLKGSMYEKLCVQNEYPPCVRQEAKLAEVKAAEHRKQYPGSKTKISFKDCHPVILARSTSNHQYIPLMV